MPEDIRYLLCSWYRPRSFISQNLKGLVNSQQGQKGQKVKVIFQFSGKYFSFKCIQIHYYTCFFNADNFIYHKKGQSQYTLMFHSLPNSSSKIFSHLKSSHVLKMITFFHFWWRITFYGIEIGCLWWFIWNLWHQFCGN